jgi:hypothetical protein
MMKKISNKIFLLSSYVTLCVVNPVSAKIGEWSSKLYSASGAGKTGSAYSPAAGNEGDIATFIGKIIWIGPFLGIIFIIQMVTAGYEWMTAAGDAKKVDEAKKRITNAIIGMILFISLYVMAVFIIKSLVTVIG